MRLVPHVNILVHHKTFPVMKIKVHTVLYAIVEETTNIRHITRPAVQAIEVRPHICEAF
jgi:hypothetical protein